MFAVAANLYTEEFGIKALESAILKTKQADYSIMFAKTKYHKPLNSTSYRKRSLNRA